MKRPLWSLVYYYLGHVNRLRVEAVDELTEDDPVTQEQCEVMRASSGGEGGVAGRDDFELVEPRDALLPQRVHAGHWTLDSTLSCPVAASTTSLKFHCVVT